MTSPDEDSTGGGSGDGGALGTPSWDTKEEPPGTEQDSTMVVSGGDVADKGSEDSAM
jgi:hypothetical protein